MPLHSSMPTVRPLTVPLALALVDPPACQLITDATRVADGASADGHDGAGSLSDGAAIAAHDGVDYAGTAIAARDGRNGGDGTGPAGRIVAAVNFTSDPMTLGLPDGQPERATLMMSTDPDRAVGDADLRRFVLLPSEAVLLLMPVVAATADSAPARPAEAVADLLRVR
jgi:hypothetical protein